MNLYWYLLKVDVKSGGYVQGYDVHMNLVLDKAEEEINGVMQEIGTLIIRGDNVIYISP